MYKISKKEIESNNVLYKEFRHNYGITPEGLGWNSQYDQEKRFEVLLEITKFTGQGLTRKSVLDVGCGFADMYDYIKKDVDSFEYTGIDINPSNLEIAKKKKEAIKLILGNILNNELPKHDFIFSSGLFATKLKDNEAFIRDMITKMVELANIGVAFNFLKKTPFVSNLAEYEPSEIYRFCKKNFKKVKLIDGYLTDDATILIKK